jgi:hypothetical protein
LVEQGLEQMKVAPIDERDVDLVLAQRARRFEAAEAGADDHHSCSGWIHAPILALKQVYTKQPCR